ncbi:cation:proton antiporter [Roseomonas sp. JC162]|uniref:Cation:proton antiporter n=1 Tax=Neoroseomonas marina TaxID=1232220 RepID=A0A848ECK1_9PROT|nr:cation:proton antiporter [Neoroseomonas marina]
MHDADHLGLIAFFVAIAVAAAVPALLPRLAVPGVVLEILLGSLLGPPGLGLLQVGPIVSLLADLGLALLFFMAGFEVDPAVLRGRPMRLAVGGWVASAVIGGAVAFALHGFGIIEGPGFVALAVTTTAIGALMPILRDAGQLGPPYGPLVLAAGAVGEAAPIIGLSLLLAGAASIASQSAILLLGALASLAAVIGAARFSEGRFAALMARTMGGAGQLPLRLALLLTVVLVVLSETAGVDLVLGAFVAGAIGRAAMPHDLHESLMARLDGVGYGLLVPCFFIASGARLEVGAILAEPLAIALMPLFAAIMLAARGVPAMLLYRGDLDRGQRAALALHLGTQLPLVVAIASLAVRQGAMPAWQGTALVGGGILTILIYPMLAGRLLRRSARIPPP